MVINKSNIKAGYMVHIHSWETDGRFSTKVLNELSKETVIMQHKLVEVMDVMTDM